jgi:protein TonB
MAYLRRKWGFRWSAMAAAIAVTGLIGAVIVLGLKVSLVSAVVDRLATFNVPLSKPPPPPRPPQPRPKPKPAKREEGAPAKKAQATPVVVPKPKIELPAKQVAATIAGTGSASTSGAGGSGNGTGAGGSGNGSGAGGAGFTPARKITKIPDSQYRRLASLGQSSGRVGVSIRVNADGSASGCRVVSSSGNSAADSLMCDLTERYVRFSPARDPSGRAIAQQVTFYPDWHRR